MSVDSLDSMALHVSVVGLALLFGYAVKRGLMAIEASSEQLTKMRFFSAFPLFPFAMFGGILIQLVADRTLGARRARSFVALSRSVTIPPRLLRKVCAICLDELVVPNVRIPLVHCRRACAGSSRPIPGR